MEGTKFLEDRYKLNAEPAVEAAARRTKRATSAPVPQNYDARIGNYFERLEKIFDPPPLEGHPDFNRAQRNVNMLKPAILDRFVTKFEDIPESYWKTQERILRERGQQGDYDRFSEEQKNKWKRELSQGLLEDQQASLEQWIDYLTSPDLKDVPSYVKYWVFRSVVGLSEYDKEKKEYPQRSKGTVKMFPDVNGEALAYVMDALLKHHKNLPISFDMFDSYLDPAKKEELIAEFRKSLEKENFAMLYAWANEQIRPIPEGEMLITEGQWIRYKQGSDHIPLVTSIRGKGTGWCTAGESFAARQLKNGDFYIFYSNDDEGNAVNPRIAIRMEGDRIAEVRGIAVKQNLDPYMGEVLSAKLDEFPDKEKYLKKEKDMNKLTEIDNKFKAGEELDRDELRFLYEVDSIIEGFGNEKDSRIKELREVRDREADMSIVFDCEPSQIARTPDEINVDTKVYVGELQNGVFEAIKQNNVEHVFTSFPEGKIKIERMKIGGRTYREIKDTFVENATMLNKAYISALDAAVDRNGNVRTPEREVVFVRIKTSEMLRSEEHEIQVEDYNFGVYMEGGRLSLSELLQRAEEKGLSVTDFECAVYYSMKYISRTYLDDRVYVPNGSSSSGYFLFESYDGLESLNYFKNANISLHSSEELIFML